MNGEGTYGTLVVKGCAWSGFEIMHGRFMCGRAKGWEFIRGIGYALTWGLLISATGSRAETRIWLCLDEACVLCRQRFSCCVARGTFV